MVELLSLAKGLTLKDGGDKSQNSASFFICSQLFQVELDKYEDIEFPHLLGRKEAEDVNPNLDE